MHRCADIWVGLCISHVTPFECRHKHDLHFELTPWVSVGRGDSSVSTISCFTICKNQLFLYFKQSAVLLTATISYTFLFPSISWFTIFYNNNFQCSAFSKYSSCFLCRMVDQIEPRWSSFLPIFSKQITYIKINLCLFVLNHRFAMGFFMKYLSYI